MSPLTPLPKFANQTADIVVVGAGVVGLSLARELKLRSPDLKIIILEKELDLGKHASGRNSGVLHSGIYYPEGSLKAKVCREGSDVLAEYCHAENLPLDRCGKVIVPVRPTDDAQLTLLYNRAIANGVPVEWIDAQQLKALEPDAHTITGKALYVQSTAAFDPKAILQALFRELVRLGVEIRFGQKVQDVDPEQGVIQLPEGSIHFGYLFNTAGLHADRIAKNFDLAKKYTVVPFKGLYYQLDKQSGLSISRHIYPVPDLNMPFLGVHFTKSISCKIYLGPTAVPALGRENYRGLSGIEWGEAPVNAWHLLQLYMANQQGFRQFTHEESGRYFKPCFAQAAKALVPKLESRHLLACDKVGIRPQFLDLEKKTLVMDFLVERGEKSTHILNAISPAFTCAFTFARFVLDNYFDSSEMECEKSYATQG